jgi:hypothetical protein
MSSEKKTRIKHKHGQVMKLAESSKQRSKQQGQASAEKQRQPKKSTVLKLKPSINIQQERRSILAGGWKAMKPKDIVHIFRLHYLRSQSAAVMLSNLKKQLRELEDGPDETYLKKLALTRGEYNEIRKEALDSVTEARCAQRVDRKLRGRSSSASLSVPAGQRPQNLATGCNLAQRSSAHWVHQDKQIFDVASSVPTSLP